MDMKCRICLKYRKKLRSIYSKENGITFADMISSISNVKIKNNDLISKLICVACCQKLGHAFSFKLDIERSDLLLQEQNNKKRINFSNINDILIVIDIEGKPSVPVLDAKLEQLFKNGEEYVTYNDITIKRVTSSPKPEKPLSVQEFLNNIKFERDSGDDEIGDTGEYFDSGSNYSLDIKPTLKKKKYLKNNKNKENIDTKKNNSSKEKGQIMETPIKPKYMRDIIVVPFKRNLKKKKDKPNKKKGEICPYCGKLYTNVGIHILTHSDKRKFECDTCSKSFYTMSGLRKHNMLLHAEHRRYKCEHCVATFPEKSALFSHMLMHSEEKKHICDICSKGFKRKNALRRHLNTIHNLGPKPVACELCTMTFHTVPSMRHHMRVHTGERPYNCEMCSQPYSYKRDFNRHCLKKHGVYLNRRPVNVMNEIVLQREKVVMKELMLKANGVLNRDELPESFEGPQAALAFEQAMTVIKNMKIPLNDLNVSAPLAL